jgi:hypothetical protein
MELTSSAYCSLTLIYLRYPKSASLPLYPSSCLVSGYCYDRPRQPFTTPFQLFTSNGQYHSEFIYQPMAFRGEDPASNHAEQLSMLAMARRRKDHGRVLARSVFNASLTILFRVVRIKSKFFDIDPARHWYIVTGSRTAANRIPSAERRSQRSQSSTLGRVALKPWYCWINVRRIITLDTSMKLSRSKGSNRSPSCFADGSLLSSAIRSTSPKFPAFV